jgi:hypothetical protein
MPGVHNRLDTDHTRRIALGVACQPDGQLKDRLFNGTISEGLEILQYQKYTIHDSCLEELSIMQELNRFAEI